MTAVVFKTLLNLHLSISCSINQKQKPRLETVYASDAPRFFFPFMSISGETKRHRGTINICLYVFLTPSKNKTPYDDVITRYLTEFAYLPVRHTMLYLSLNGSLMYLWEQHFLKATDQNSVNVKRSLQKERRVSNQNPFVVLRFK